MYIKCLVYHSVYGKQYLSAADVNGTVVFSLLSPLQHSEVTEHKSLPQASYTPGKDGHTLTPDLPLAS